jgi:hypothetical protein
MSPLFKSFLMPLRPLWTLAAFQSPDLFTIGRTPWTSDQLLPRLLPKHRRGRPHNKHIYTPNFHALSGIRTRDPSVRASEDSSCFRPLGYRDRLSNPYFRVIRGHHSTSFEIKMLLLCLLQNVVVSTKLIRNPLNQNSPNNISYMMDILTMLLKTKGEPSIIINSMGYSHS